MVVPGGLPHNARLLYAAPGIRSGPARQTLARFQAGRPKKWMDLLIEPVDGRLPCETGELPDSTRRGLRALLGEWGFSEREQDHWLGVFAREFSASDPLSGAAVSLTGPPGRRPGQAVALDCRRPSRARHPMCRFQRPWGAYRTPAGDLKRIQGRDLPEPLSDVAQMAADFSKDFPR